MIEQVVPWLQNRRSKKGSRLDYYLGWAGLGWAGLGWAATMHVAKWDPVTS